MRTADRWMIDIDQDDAPVSARRGVGRNRLLELMVGGARPEMSEVVVPE